MVGPVMIFHSNVLDHAPADTFEGNLRRNNGNTHKRSRVHNHPLFQFNKVPLNGN